MLVPEGIFIVSKYTHDIDTMTVEGDEHFICKDFTRPQADKEYMDRVMAFVRKVIQKKG
ncbi:MAG: hypothetical protein PUD32_02840 [Bacteroidales bacterium]|nr:hypothetical protein [Bacteroidales bacterium]